MGLPKIVKKLLPTGWVYRYELRSLHQVINSDMTEAVKRVAMQQHAA